MQNAALRDVMINEIHKKMLSDEKTFFLSADFGSPALDKLREDCSDRFINVGIAEQNLINIATGLALEGFVVYAYAIAPFLTMRAYEQIRNLSLLAQIKELNINMIGVGVGLSYDVTGPTHHCLEDLSIINILPNIEIFSPCDIKTTKIISGYLNSKKKPKYIRLDGKPQSLIYDNFDLEIDKGFYELKEGNDIVIISTGFMTHVAIKVSEMFLNKGINCGVIDIFRLKPINNNLLIKILSQYNHIITLEESFINKAGLDTIISSVLINKGIPAKYTRLGFDDKYVFEVGNRQYLHKINGLDIESILNKIEF